MFYWIREYILTDRSYLACFGAMSVVGLGWMSLAPRPSQTVAVIFPPWTSSGEAMHRIGTTDASLVRLGRLPFIVIVQPRHDPLTVLRLGAVFILDASSVRGCVSVSHT